MGLLACKNYTSASSGLESRDLRDLPPRCDLGERTNRGQSRAPFFSSQSRKMLREKCGWGSGEAKNMAWVTGRRCTREQSALPQSWGRERGEEGVQPPVVPVLVSTERKRTYAVRALGQWCAWKRRLAFRLLSHHELVAGFSSRESEMLTLSRMQ